MLLSKRRHPSIESLLIRLGTPRRRHLTPASDCVRSVDIYRRSRRGARIRTDSISWHIHAFPPVVPVISCCVSLVGLAIPRPTPRGESPNSWHERADPIMLPHLRPQRSSSPPDVAVVELLGAIGLSFPSDTWYQPVILTMGVRAGSGPTDRQEKTR